MRIVANTLSSYVRLFVVALVALLATPFALRTLGPSDYGIFSVIGGSLAFLMFINGALTTGAQRHIAYALGEGSTEKAGRWFAASMLIHLLLATVIASGALAATHLILVRVLTLPSSRMVAAVWIYRMVVFTMICDILSAPYQALLMAHEAIVSLSVMSIIGSAFVAVGVLSLRSLPGDSLLWYSAIYCSGQAIILLGPAVYCHFRHAECQHFRLRGVGRRNIGDLLSFSGWNFFGALSLIVRTQGPAVVLNMFFGPIANAAYGLSLQVNGFAFNLSSGVLRATSPPIVKRTAAGDKRGMATLSNLSSTYSFAILWLALAPVLFNMDFCLKLWLRTVPPNTAAFATLLLVAVLIDQLTSGFLASLQATGRIAAYQLVVGSMNCLPVLAGYFCLRRGMPATSVLWAGIGGVLLAGCGRLWFAHALAGISVRSWCTSVLVPTVLCAIATCSGEVVILHALHVGFVRFAVTTLANAAILCLVLWKFGTSVQQRAKLRVTAARLCQNPWRKSLQGAL
jgi:O-antigen/teichoic acid export membrane protein